MTVLRMPRRAGVPRLVLYGNFPSDAAQDFVGAPLQCSTVDESVQHGGNTFNQGSAPSEQVSEQ